MAEVSGKERILDAGERLMAAGGSGSVSLRQIIAEAGTNPASIHYHFGSRDALVEAILERRMRPIAQRRRELLDELELPGAFSLRGALVVLLRPLLELRGRGGGADSYLRFVAELFRSRSPILTRVISEHFGDTMLRLVELLEQALPEIPSRVLALRLWLGMEGVIAAIADPTILGQFLDEDGQPPRNPKPEDLARVETLLLDFLEGSFRAPHTGDATLN